MFQSFQLQTRLQPFLFGSPLSQILHRSMLQFDKVFQNAAKNLWTLWTCRLFDRTHLGVGRNAESIDIVSLTHARSQIIMKPQDLPEFFSQAAQALFWQTPVHLVT